MRSTGEKQEDPKLCSRNKNSWDLLQKKSDLDLIGLSDSDRGGDNTYQKYTSQYVFMLIEGQIV